MTERPVSGDDAPRSDAPAETVPRRDYWEAERSAAMPAAAVRPAYERAESMPVAILIDDELPALGAGGPHFAAAPPTTARQPPGMRVPSAPAPGSEFSGPLGTMPRKKMRKRRRSRRLLVDLVVLALLGAGVYAAYPRVRAMLAARSVPAALRPYVEGQGVRFDAVGSGYSVRLPAQPTRRDPQLTSSDHRVSAVAHWAIVAGDGYQIVVWEADLSAPPATIFPEGLLGALLDPSIGGHGVFGNVRRVQVAGEAAYEGVLAAPNVEPMRVAVFVHSSRLYVIRVESRSAGTVLDALARSFRFSS